MRRRSNSQGSNKTRQGMRASLLWTRRQASDHGKRPFSDFHERAWSHKFYMIPTVLIDTEPHIGKANAFEFC